MLIEALITLLHVLVFVYWLGGDLGAFYTSRFLIKPNVGNEHRMLALKIVNDVDMAPRTSLILALPSGLLVAQSKGWIELPLYFSALIIMASLVWLAIVWKLHLSHGKANKAIQHAEMIFRHFTLLTLLVSGACGLAGILSLPTFISAKLIILASCISLGLYIRLVLKPLGTAIALLNGPDSLVGQAQIALTLNRARPLVTGIWVLLILAAVLGLWTPTSF